MVKKRVHELAKELKIESKEIINRLNQMGINVKSHMSTLEDGVVERLHQLYRPDQEEVKPAAAKPPAAGQTIKPEEVAPQAQPESRKKDAAMLDSQKPDRDRVQKNGRERAGKATRADHYKGAGLVERVPSRPPDRRFQERPKQSDKARPWGQPRADQGARLKTADFVQERTRSARAGQDYSQPEKVQQERGQDRQQKERPPFEKAQQPRPQHEHKPQDSVKERPHPERASREADNAKRAERLDKGAGKTAEIAYKSGLKALEKAQVGTKPQRAGERGARPGGLHETKPKKNLAPGDAGYAKLWQEQTPVIPQKLLDDRRRQTEEKVKVTEKQKQQAKSQKLVKSREKRNAMAELAEERLRPRPAVAGSRKKGAAKPQEQAQKPAQPLEKKPIVLGESTTVQELALKMHKSPAELIKKLMQLGVMATINQEIDTDTATILAGEFGYEVEVKLPVDIEAMLMQEPEDDPVSLQDRPCVVTVMGHVDHGKTSLLDAIRETNVTATEAGGITQHIGAYQVEHNGKKITFLDTPGHEAFTAMRARGARVTDIAILVVAADDGVMPQTVEAINHAKEAKVPIIVAINKIDKPGANPDRVKQQLTEHGLVAEEWGGDTICVNVSALKKEGLKDLLEMILLVAEMSELKANPNRPARGTVIEAELDKGRGPVANVLVQNGTLNVGDTLIAGAAFGRVRAMMDDKGRRIKKAGPSTPVEVLGFSEVPQAGDIFVVVEDEKLARTIVARRQARKREEELKSTARVSLADLFKHIQEGQIKELGIIIKADVQGSVEALRQALERLSTDEVRVNIIHGGVGAITETDVMLASASNAIIIGFNVRPDVNARKAAENEKVDVRLYRVIYDAIEDVKAAMSGLLEPEYREVTLGRAEIRKIFRSSKIGNIAGCYVLEGKIERDASVRVIRDGIVVHEGKLESLKRFKDDVREVVQGYECGIALEKFNEIQEGDIIEAFTVEAIKRQLT